MDQLSSFPREARGRALLAALPAVLALLSGCATVSAPPGRMHSDSDELLDGIRTTAVVPPDLTLNTYSAGGVREERDEWSEAARASARATLESLRPERLVYLADLELDPGVEEELIEVQALYRAIDANMTIYNNPMVALPTVLGRFDYSVGSIDSICDAVGADALLLVYGENDYFTTDRKALVALGIVAGAFTGVYAQPAPGREHLSAALIARDGTILWYNAIGAGQIGDLRDPEGARKTVEILLSSMPHGRAPIESN